MALQGSRAVDELRDRRQDPLMLTPADDLLVRIERGRGALCVTASSRDTAPLLVEVTLSGGPEGVWFRLEERGKTRVFSQHVVARHRSLAAILRLIGDEVELSKPPSEALIGLLIRSLLVYVSRMERAVPLPRWGRPLRDRRIERALELLDTDLTKYWTVAHLARAVGLSRPVFARQFVRMLGLSPMRYLARRRLQRAAELLLETDQGLAEVAAHVGYRSEFAFGRAFKRQHGIAPGTYRRHASVACGGALASAA